ncbi:MAG: YgiT-type zinc finger protein [Chloroflexi bacterium]|nr:YgiT-type zinc finger protein [Chloroflexota bacterium]
MKGLITVCHECGTKTELRLIRIEFERKCVHAAMTGIPAMVCPRCGTEYVPAEIAGDVIDTVSRTIDQTEALLKRTEAHRRTLAPPQHALRPERLELALVS